MSLHSSRKNQSPSLHCSIFFSLSKCSDEVTKHCSLPLLLHKDSLDVSAVRKSVYLRFTSHCTLRGRLREHWCSSYSKSVIFTSRDNSLYFCHILYFHSQRICCIVGKIGNEKKKCFNTFCPISVGLLWWWKDMRYHDRSPVLVCVERTVCLES